MNVYRKFYFPKTQGTFTKPRFALAGESLVLLPNPIQTGEERDRLANPDFVATLGANDFWFNHAHLPKLSFPYTLILFDKLFWRQMLPHGRVTPSDVDAAPDFDLWEQREARDLAIAILQRFVSTAAQRGDKPILFHLPAKHEGAAWKRDAATPRAVEVLRSACSTKRWQCLFPVLHAERIFIDSDASFAPGGHYSAVGNEHLAEYLGSQLRAH